MYSHTHTHVHTLSSLFLSFSLLLSVSHCLSLSFFISFSLCLSLSLSLSLSPSPRSSPLSLSHTHIYINRLTSISCSSAKSCRKRFKCVRSLCCLCSKAEYCAWCAGGYVHYSGCSATPPGVPDWRPRAALQHDRVSGHSAVHAPCRPRPHGHRSRFWQSTGSHGHLGPDPHNLVSEPAGSVQERNCACVCVWEREGDALILYCFWQSP